MAALLRNIFKIQTNQSIVFTRFISRNIIRNEKTAPTIPPVASAEQSGILSGKTHKVNNLEKRILVWAGKYKNKNDVPAWVTPESVEKARNRARIRIANYMMLATALACLGMIISGKRAAGRGESVQKANIEWHKRVKEDSMKNEK